MTLGEGLRNIERGIRPEGLIITPDSLYDENRSDIARLNRDKHNEAKRKGECTLYSKCSDARGATVGINAVSWGSVGAADEPSANLLRNKDNGTAVALAHYDGDTVGPKEPPLGCTALWVKSLIGDMPEQNGVRRFVSENVKYKDPLMQAWYVAINMATLSGKPTLAALQDHLTLEIFPIAEFLSQSDGGMDIRTRVNIRHLLDRNYDPKKIYENGIPAISQSRLTDDFIKILQENARERQEILSKYPDLKKMQKVQNPRVAFISTEIMSLKTIYPVLTSVPGSCYKVIIPRNKIEGGHEHVTEENLRKSLDQLELPMKEGVENYGNPNGEFSDTDRLIVQTEDLELSKEIAQRVMQEKSVAEWKNLDGREIIIVQAISGVVIDAKRYGP